MKYGIRRIRLYGLMYYLTLLSCRALRMGYVPWRLVITAIVKICNPPEEWPCLHILLPIQITEQDVLMSLPKWWPLLNISLHIMYNYNIIAQTVMITVTLAISWLFWSSRMIHLSHTSHFQYCIKIIMKYSCTRDSWDFIFQVVTYQTKNFQCVAKPILYYILRGYMFETCHTKDG